MPDLLDLLDNHIKLYKEQFSILNLAIGKLNVDTEHIFTALRLLDNPDVNRILGPTPQELKAAETRVEILEKLSPLCDFGSDSTDPTTVSSRRSYNTIMDIQSHFEKKYC